MCVGRPLRSVRLEVLPLGSDGRPDPAQRPATTQPDVTGEIVVHAAHVKQRYDGLWATQRDSVTDDGGHRTGDVGHLDDEGRLWVEGRLVHVLTTADGPVTPVGAEQLVEAVPGVARAALVGVGPAGAQVPVLVVEPSPGAAPGAGAGRRGGLAAARSRGGGTGGGRPAGAATSPRSSPYGTCPSTSGTTPRSTAPRWRGWAGRVLAGERVGRAVRVLVTGASGMLGGGVAQGARRARRRRGRPAAPAQRPRADRGARRRRRPGRGPGRDGRRRRGRPSGRAGRR